MHAPPSPTPVSVGFAVHPGGAGVAFAALHEADGGRSVVRIAFRCRPLVALGGRDVAYAALAAVAGALLECGRRDVVFRVAEAGLVTDLTQRRTLPAALTVPYVELRCRLNRFATARFDVRPGDPAVRELTARARAEASFDIAA